ncbi:MAG: hypothetical protein JW892_14405, partial [Anaerolineae bacterium]|nr:hypothetical protein [Anaerolineae bacterium]
PPCNLVLETLAYIESALSPNFHRIVYTTRLVLGLFMDIIEIEHAVIRGVPVMMAIAFQALAHDNARG